MVSDSGLRGQGLRFRIQGLGVQDLDELVLINVRFQLRSSCLMVMCRFIGLVGSCLGSFF